MKKVLPFSVSAAAEQKRRDSSAEIEKATANKKGLFGVTFFSYSIHLFFLMYVRSFRKTDPNEINSVKSPRMHFARINPFFLCEIILFGRVAEKLFVDKWD